VALTRLAEAPGDAVVLELRRPSDGQRRSLLAPPAALPAAGWTRYRFPLAGAELSGQWQLYLAVLNRLAGAPGAVTAVAADALRLDACTGPAGPVARAHLPLAVGGPAPK
jgi:hypothetical protein